jgi:phosphonopyruvate decarboxylase
VIEAANFVGRALAYGFNLYTGVPCSYLKPFINYVIDADEIRYVGAANEGDAIGIAAGAQLGGRRAVVMLQNSGLGNTVNPLTSLTETFQIPVLMIVTLRGEPGGAPDEPQHELMGRITTDMLELMQVDWAWFPTDDAEIDSALAQADAHLQNTGRPFALIMRKGSVAKNELKTRPDVRSATAKTLSRPPPAASRTDMLRGLQSAVDQNDVLVATTGFTGRELYAIDDRANQLYIVGSMGCASSIGLGIALACPQRRVIVIDGDGAALMRLGALSTIGYERPPNLVHVLLDNGVHESTGGQTTVSGSIDLPGVASACGYPRVIVAGTPEALAEAVTQPSGELTFIYAPIHPGSPDDLPRPSITPPEVAERLRANLTTGR